LLGALALGDIGIHFPNTDPDFKDIDSKKLLAHTLVLIQQQGYEVVNIDSTLCLEKPKISPHLDAMRDAIASVLQIDRGAVSIKATTTEKMGFAGREEGLMAQATALLKKRDH
jgi:2-C-methyl-D-erythritol 2,4-cyclodiphosphate synthase